MDTSDELDRKMDQANQLVDDWQKTLRQQDQVVAGMAVLTLIAIGIAIFTLEMHR